MTKRTFFKSIMGAVAAVALAPEIAFGVKLPLKVHPPVQSYDIYWWIEQAVENWLTTKEYVDHHIISEWKAESHEDQA